MSEAPQVSTMLLETLASQTSLLGLFICNTNFTSNGATKHTSLLILAGVFIFARDVIPCLAKRLFIRLKMIHVAPYRTFSWYIVYTTQLNKSSMPIFKLVITNYIITKSMRALWLVKQLWVIVPVNPGHGKIVRLLNYYIKAIDHKFLWVTEFFSCSTNIPLGLSAFITHPCIFA